MNAKAKLRLAVTLTVALLMTNQVAMARKQLDIDDKSKDKNTAAPTSNSGDDSPAPCASWTDPLNPARAALLCIHGLGLNSDAYSNLGKRLSHRGISVYAIDVRGFGSWMKSQGNSELDFN